MQERPKDESEGQETLNDNERKDLWVEDQAERSYYYDDAHGYERFDPDREISDDDEDPAGSSSSSEIKR